MAAGALCNHVLLNWQGGEVRSNAADRDAGGLYILDEATATLTGVTFAQNTAARGAALIVDAAEVLLAGGALTDNTATDWGGGVWMPGFGRLTFEGVALSGNTPDEVYTDRPLVVGPTATTVCEAGSCSP